MTKATTITINGRLYDAITGMPISQSASKPVVKAAPAAQATAVQKRPVKVFSDIGPSRIATQPLVKPVRQVPAIQQTAAPKVTATLERPTTHVAQIVHQRPQKSQTLYRKALKKPHVKAEATSPSRSPLISRFGPFNKPARMAADMATVAQAKVAEPEVERITKLHPAVTKVLQKQAAKRQAKQPQARSSKELKEMLIKERLAEVDEPKEAKKGLFARQPRLGTILASSLALLVLGGYITYINLPNISMKVAASHAGIAASFPNYRPDGYSLNGPITYAPGEVTISYKSNSNTEGFRLTQKASKWDSQALLDNYVMKQTDTYLTFQERGLTVYTFENKAAWTNGGLLYTVEGEANLSSDQVLRLATSL